MNKLYPEIYRDAAEVIFNEDSYEKDNSYNKYCCNSIREAQYNYPNFIEDKDFKSYNQLFSFYFKPKTLPSESDQFGWWGAASPETDEQRILALLLMELIAEDLNKE